MSIRLDINWYKLLGIPEPTKTAPRDPSLGEIEFKSPTQEKLRLLWLWIKENSLLVGIVGMILTIILTSLLRVHRGGK